MIAAAILLCALAPFEGGLIENGSFEESDGRMPFQWHAFVAPMEGAEAILDEDRAHDGQRSARLYVPAPYPREPYNNWSQNILRPLAGERLVLEAAVKTHAAGGAAVWVQCFARSPLRELRRFSTADERPMYGTRDWTPLSMTIDIPAETDFITVRCVLTGTGTAWFDAVSLRRRADDPPAEPELSETELTVLEPPDGLERLDDEHLVFVEELLQANRVLLDTVRELRDSNAGLARNLDALQEELRAIRGEVTRMRAQTDALEDPAEGPGEPPSRAAARPTIDRPTPPELPVPPLVPVDHELARRSPRE